MSEDPPNIKTLRTFFDYTITKRRQYIDAASTLQTYWNVWTTIRREKCGLAIPPPVKDKMIGVRDQLAEEHGLRTEKRKKPILRSEDVFELLKVLWNVRREAWDPLQLALIILLAGITGHRPDALVTMLHNDVAVTLFPTERERPHMVLEIKPHKTKRYRGRKKQNPTLGIPEVPSEPCLLLCPKTLLLGLLLRKSAFRHLHIESATQLYHLKVPTDAGSLPLRPADPDARLFDISAGTLNSWLKRLGELAGFDLPITSYWLRRGAGEAVNSSSEISEAQQNLLLQHASGSTYQDRYAPDYFPVDFSAAWRDRPQQHKVIRMASGQSRSINLRRPVDLSPAQETEAEAQPEVQRRKRLWQQAKHQVQLEYGTFANGKGTEMYEKALRQRNRYHTAHQASRRAMKETLRARFNQEQPVQDVIRQIYGLPIKPQTLCESDPTPPEQKRAFALLFRFAPSSEREETECRAAAVDALSHVGPSLKRRLRSLQSDQSTSTWMNNALYKQRHVRLNRRQSLNGMFAGTTTNKYDAPILLVRTS
ncbi:hypothetical protein EYZ11_013038 [Aspergillus tanneri]|uniref:Uncharacterized protein n=1 Tax=Aspergillus tanneri TaxID=1220188 RepID=A0A4S3IYY2_9EURO|nr:hypothetical protein EYZ11_013038 [Aspergillus tanneri]